MLLAAAAAAALIFGFGGAGGGAGSGRHHGGGASPGGLASGTSQPVGVLTGPVGPVTQFGLLAPGVGWGVLSDGFYMTRDGGRRWVGLSVGTRHGNAYGTRTVPGFGLTGDISANITATASPSSSTLAIGFIDGRAGASCTPPRSPATGAGAIVVTADGGRTWKTHILPGCGVPSALSFIGPNLGFADLEGSSAGSSRQLYLTTDGAASWRFVGELPVFGPIAFANAHDGLDGGWILGGGRVDSGAIYRTTNGGRTWARTSLCRPPGQSCQAPVMFRSGRAVMPVAVTNARSGGTQLVVYTSDDDGLRWSGHAVPGTTSLEPSEYVPFAAPDPRHLFAWLGPYLYRSTDGGDTWSRNRIPALARIPNPQLAQLDFASADYGWIGVDADFEYTSDGGRTWKPVGTR